MTTADLSILDARLDAVQARLRNMADKWSREDMTDLLDLRTALLEDVTAQLAAKTAEVERLERIAMAARVILVAALVTPAAETEEDA